MLNSIIKIWSSYLYDLKFHCLRVHFHYNLWSLIDLIRKDINPEYSFEGLMLKLELQYLGYLMRTADSGKDPDASKD